ncbi:50S ribosomal protein L32 [Pontiella sulfatireligans]|uniref:Large ribosomal subunit protein bL32 n=1 Tax=Pontiella sulfatireligans TaxID=2750658 RepID=A0A6C2UK24_9BACT|nr:50S ribosomal protein L32 [Pontiella sulfatireligans]VGO20580.1 50S ribosomal protein L32 [Pontiella sulfatireligans]
MAVPKRKTSKSKTASRKAQNMKKPISRASSCSQCGSPALPHHACPSCGYYNGRQVLTVATEE